MKGLERLEGLGGLETDWYAFVPQQYQEQAAGQFPAGVTVDRSAVDTASTRTQGCFPIAQTCPKFQSNSERFRTDRATINDSGLQLTTSGRGNHMRLRFGLPAPPAQYLSATRTEVHRDSFRGQDIFRGAEV